MTKPRTWKHNRSGRRGGSPGWHRELVELGALFLAVAWLISSPTRSSTAHSVQS